MSSSATKPTTHTNSLSRSRPTTPLRPSSRSSFRSSKPPHASTNNTTPLEQFEPQFAELSDSMASLEANLMDLQTMHESLSRFSESFASFLYGLNMNAYCVDFPEAPINESFKRAKAQEESSDAQSLAAESTQNAMGGGGGGDNETTFMTTDTEFVENPPTSSARAAGNKFSTPAPAARGRGRGIPVPRGGAGSRGRGGLPTARGRGRGVRS